MIIGSKKRLSQVTADPAIGVGNLEIKRVEMTKNIGPNDRQVEHISKKVTPGLVFLRRLRDTVEFNTLITIYQTIIQPYFDYCAQVWGCLWKTLAAKVQKLQNTAFRIITRENYTTRSAVYIKQARSSEPRKKKNATTFNSHVLGEKQIGPRLLV
jgi:hypothetical protein